MYIKVGDIFAQTIVFGIHDVRGTPLDALLHQSPLLVSTRTQGLEDGGSGMKVAGDGSGHDRFIIQEQKSRDSLLH